MKLALVPETDEERALLEAGALPTPLIEMALGMVGAAALIAPADSAPVRDVLRAFGWDTDEARAWLEDPSLAPLRRYAVDQWGLLSGLIAGQEPLDIHQREHPPGFWERYLEALEVTAGETCAELAALLPLDAPQRLLDVGGGSGTWARAVCDRHEGLTATVLELAPAVAASHGDSDGSRGESPPWDPPRIRFEVRDVRHGAWGEGFDCALLINLLPHLTSLECRAACHYAREALVDGGVVAIVQPRPFEPGAPGEAVRAASALLFHLAAGRPPWPETDLRSWLADAGFSVRSASLESAPDTLLLIGQAGVP